MTSEQDNRVAAKAADNKNKIIAIVIGIAIFAGIGWFVYEGQYFAPLAPTTKESIAHDKDACINAVKSLTPYPEKSDFLADMLALGNDARRTIEGRVELADDKGNLFRHTFKCVMDEGKVSKVDAVRG